MRIPSLGASLLRCVLGTLTDLGSLTVFQSSTRLHLHRGLQEESTDSDTSPHTNITATVLKAPVPFEKGAQCLPIDR